MRNVLTTLFIALAFVCVAVSVLRADEAMTILVFYDAHDIRIGEGEFVFPDHLEGQRGEGKWRFKLAVGYKKPRQDVISASDMLNKPDWQKLRSDRTSRGVSYINLHPSAEMDWIFLTPAMWGPILSGSWTYCTDGGVVEEGRFSSP